MMVNAPPVGVSRKRARSTSVSSMPGPESPFRQSHVMCTMSIPPAYIGNALQGVHELLNDRILEFDDRLGGVLLTYSDVRFAESDGVVADGEPEMQFRVSFKALLFVAKPGMRLDGKIKQANAGHLMLHVCGAFQVSVDRDKIPSRYKYSSALGKFISSDDDADVLEAGGDLNVQVIAVHSAGSQFFIEAAMVEEGGAKRARKSESTSNELLKQAIAEASKKDKSGKKKKSSKKDKKKKKSSKH